MIPCPCCAVARDMPDYNMFNSLACVYCGARQIKRISRYQIAQSEATRRMRDVLHAMLAPPYLHNEMQIRALVKTGPWIEPLPVAIEQEAKQIPKAKKTSKSKTNSNNRGTTPMHRKYPDPVVLPSPHSRGHHEHSSADEKAGLLNHYCGPGQTDCPTLSDDYDLDVGLAGALQ